MKDEEELLEVKNAENKEEVKKELADKLEIIIAIAKIHHYSLEDIIEEANNKRNTNGGFNKKIFLEKVISNK